MPALWPLYLPLYRQVQILTGQGIDLDCAALAGWVKRAAWWLKSLYELQLQTIQASPRPFCDDTPLRVLDSGRRRTRICQFAALRWMTGYGRAPRRRRWPMCLPTAAARSEIAGQLTGFSGILQVDGYVAYEALARSHGGAIQLAFGLAHARRRFVEVYNIMQPPFAHEVIQRLQVSTRSRSKVAAAAPNSGLPPTAPGLHS